MVCITFLRERKRMHRIGEVLSRYILPVWVACTYAFLYVPLLVLVIFSFNSVAFPYQWKGFSLQWYEQLFGSVDIWKAAANSFIVAISAVILSLTFGLFFVLWCFQSRKKWLLTFFYPVVIVPEIILAVGLLSFYVFFNIPLGLPALIMGHTLLGFGYAVPIIYTRYSALDKRMIEASLDLGANNKQTFRKIVMPLLKPALIAAGILIFILSFDDFLIAFFCANASSQTLSLYIFSMIRSGVSPVVNALATLMLIVSGILVAVYSFIKVKEDMEKIQ